MVDVPTRAAAEAPAAAAPTPVATPRPAVTAAPPVATPKSRPAKPEGGFDSSGSFESEG
jgi:hypothetical protein